MEKNNTKPAPQGKKEKKSLLDSRNFNMIISLVIALLIWTYVTTVKDPNQTNVLGDVPVDLSYASEIYKAKELDIVNNPETTVTVRLKGNSAVVNGIKTSDLIVYPDYSLLSGPGEFKLPLQVRFADSRKGRDIEAFTNDSINLVFDSVVEKTFDVQPVTGNQMSVAEGYVLNSVVPSPAKVTVQGPKNEVDQIDHVAAVVKTSSDMQNSLMNLSESKLATAALEARDANDQPLELKYTVMDNNLADIHINVYRTKELPLRVNFINVSPNFDLANLKYTLSQETMVVTGKPSVVENLTELMVSDFDLGNSFDMNKAFQLNVELPKGVSSTDNITTVTLSFDNRGLASKTMSAGNIRVINQPAGMKIRPKIERLSNVTLIGPEKELDAIDSSNVVALIDASAAQITEGTENLAARIQIPAYKNVFAVGSYSVECSVGADGGKN